MVSCILCILCNSDLLVRSVDTFYKIQITAEKLTSLCFNLYFVSIFPFTNILLMAISPSPLLFPFFVCCHYCHHSGNSRGHPRDMKKVSISEAGHLQERFSVWELARLQISIENAKILLLSVYWLYCCSDNKVIQSQA